MTRKRIDALDHGAKAVRQVDTVYFPRVSECRTSFQEQLNDVLGRMTVLECLCGRMDGKVYSRLPALAVQCGFGDVLIVDGRCYLWIRGCRHQSYGGGGYEVGEIFECRRNQTLVGVIMRCIVQPSTGLCG